MKKRGGGLDSADGEPVLEIYRQFQPMFAAGMHRMRHMQQYAATPQAIFIAFDASNIVSAEDREQRNTLIILFALATVLLGKRVVILLVSPLSALAPAVAG
ncbi:sensor protein ZraS [Escherichia coli]|uniref:Sensor protein ZraS n=1 Tax=Escherichia coli TaxID=562 RepID=A0A2X1LN13_ECOLX|nr:sensor protein ZraS [Escherichia coli]